MDTINAVHECRDNLSNLRDELGNLRAANTPRCVHARTLSERLAACEAGIAVLEARLALAIDYLDYASTHGGTIGGVLAPT